VGSGQQPVAKVADGATLAASPDARRRAGSSVVGSSVVALPGQAELAHSTARVLRTDEAARALAFSRALTALTGCGVLALPFLYNRARPLYWPMAATLVALCAASAWMWRRTRSERGHSPAAFRVYLSLGFAVGLFVEYDLGIFSPAPLFVTLGIMFLAQSHDRAFAIGATLFAALTYLALAVLVVTGVVPDAGLISAAGASLTGRLLFTAVVPIAYGIAAWQGRQSRRATLAAIEQSHEALRLALTREAQLAEAHQDLDEALRAGARNGGRHSGALMGRYRLAEIIGRGAMGEIYAAADVGTGAPAAVKVLQASASGDPDLVERFLREGRIAVSLKAPNVVTVHDVGAAAGVPFIAMELLVGEDLSAQLRRKERLDLPAVVELVSEVARGLDAARVAGVVHRDLKPQNIFCAEQGDLRPPVWKILDFGVSKLRDSTATLTHAAVIGTPGYMSPEQAEGRDADHRSDVFSLGAVAYRALTGRPPFSGEIPHVLFEIAYKNPFRPSELYPSLPSDVDLVLALALAKRVDDRFESALDLDAALRDAARGALAPAIRARALGLLASSPWGASLRAA
jgi:eukaryotic-like serine/threonine-protein kinase